MTPKTSVKMKQGCTYRNALKMTITIIANEFLSSEDDDDDDDDCDDDDDNDDEKHDDDDD